MKRINELKKFIKNKKKNMTTGESEYIYALEDMVNYFENMNEIKSNGQVRKQTRRLLYKLHNRFVINDE